MGAWRVEGHPTRGGLTLKQNQACLMLLLPSHCSSRMKSQEDRCWWYVLLVNNRGDRSRGCSLLPFTFFPLITGK